MNNPLITCRVDINGLLSVDDNHIVVSVEDVGEVDLAKIIKDFDGFNCKISITTCDKYTFDA